MAKVTVTSESWSAGLTLTEDRTFQCVSGGVEISSESSPATNDGLQLINRNMGVTFRNGDTVKWRLLGGFGSVADLRHEAAG